MKNSYIVRGDTAAILFSARGNTMETIIDSADLPIAQAINGWWRAGIDGAGNIYVRTRGFYAGDANGVALHRAIIAAPPHLVVDHRNHDTLDNRRANLRAVCQRVNSLNIKGPLTTNTSGQTGVYWNKSKHRWHARVMIDGRYRHLGSFVNLADAALAYESAKTERLRQLGAV